MTRMKGSPDTGGRERPPHEELRGSIPHSFGDRRQQRGITAGPMDPASRDDYERGTFDRIDPRDIKSIVQRELDSSIGWENARLSEIRRRNLAQYLGLSRGDEREGRSTVITREVYEQVEWALPVLM